MIRALPLLMLIAACTSFPQVDAAAPQNLGERPAFLPREDLAAALRQPETAPSDLAAAEADLKARADDLRAR